MGHPAWRGWLAWGSGGRSARSHSRSGRDCVRQAPGTQAPGTPSPPPESPPLPHPREQPARARWQGPRDALGSAQSPAPRSPASLEPTRCRGREREGVEPSPDGAGRRATGLKPARTTRPHPLPAYGSTPAPQLSCRKGAQCVRVRKRSVRLLSPASPEPRKGGRGGSTDQNQRARGAGERGVPGSGFVSLQPPRGGAPHCRQRLAPALAPRSSRQGPWSRSGTGAAVSPIARNFL